MYVLKMIENIVGKAENCWFPEFSASLHIFPYKLYLYKDHCVDNV